MRVLSHPEYPSYCDRALPITKFSLTVAFRYLKLWYIPFALYGMAGCTIDEVPEMPDNPDRLVWVLFSLNGLGDLSFNDDILRGILQEKERNYVMFDTPIQDFTISAFRFSGYGVSFLASIATYVKTRTDIAAYMGGQRGEHFIEECYRGFRAGYFHAGGKDVAVTYISDESFGFAILGRAYQMTDSLFRLYPFIYVMAGGSNNGVYQYPGLLCLTAANADETSKVNGYSYALHTWLSNSFTDALLDEFASGAIVRQTV